MTHDYLPEGFTTLTPLLVLSPASRAITFYEEVLGARTTTRMDGPDGAVMHAELQLPSGRMQVMDPAEQYSTVASDPASDEASFSMAAYVPDVDATVDLAVERGARVREPAADFEVTGDRFASIQDPFGVRWTIMRRVQPRTDAEVQAALDEWGATLG